MKLRNIDMVVIMNNIEKFKDIKLPQRISYAITKNNMLLIEEQKVYMEEFNKITKEFDDYLIKDDNGNLKLNSNGIPMVQKEVEKEYLTKVNDLLNIEFEINLFKIDEECFNYDDTVGKYDVLSPSEIMFLQSFLCKDNKGESDK